MMNPIPSNTDHPMEMKNVSGESFYPYTLADVDLGSGVEAILVQTLRLNILINQSKGQRTRI